MSNDKKLTKKQRVINYFLDAASEIAQKSGLEAITTRNVADLAGYNSATIYNYFSNLDELLAFTVIRYVAVYLSDVSEKISNYKSDPLASYLSIWGCLCLHSFTYPQIFKHAYSSTREEMDYIQSRIGSYLEVFPDTFSEAFDPLVKQAFLAMTSEEHDRLILKPFVDINMFNAEDIDEITMYGMILYDGIINKSITLKEKSPRGYTDLFMEYFKPFVLKKINPRDTWILD